MQLYDPIFIMLFLIGMFVMIAGFHHHKKWMMGLIIMLLVLIVRISIWIFG